MYVVQCGIRAMKERSPTEYIVLAVKHGPCEVGLNILFLSRIWSWRLYTIWIQDSWLQVWYIRLIELTTSSLQLKFNQRDISFLVSVLANNSATWIKFSDTELPYLSPQAYQKSIFKHPHIKTDRLLSGAKQQTLGYGAPKQISTKCPN